MRRGFSLIELLVVIAGASVVFTVLAVSLYTLGRAQTAVRDEAHTATTLHDFARRLRDDVHLAAEATMNEGEDAPDDPSLPSLTLLGEDGRSIVYDYHPEKSMLRRRVIEGDQTVAREGFHLPRNSRVEFQRPGEENSLLVVLISRPMGSSANPSWRVTRIEAAVGLNRIEAP
jgi:prepilin-type N-terminal cleavage/methylation domain-containing protein